MEETPTMVILDGALDMGEEENENAVEADAETSNENQSEKQFFRPLLRGDVYVFPETRTLAFVVLDVIGPTSKGATYKVRLYSSVVESTTVTDEELDGYIRGNQLERLTTVRDQMDAVGPKIILKDGDVYTRDGDVFITIMSSVLLFIDENGMAQDVVGCRIGDGVVAFRNARWVKSQIYGNTDQFPPSVFGMNNAASNNEME